jgi:hypothetical protein
MTDMTKIHVTLHDHPMCVGESLWATPVEGEPEHYEVGNIPYFTYGINMGDVVRAVDTADHPREVVAVVRVSGNRTLRVMFSQDLLEPVAREIIAELRNDFNAKAERAMGTLFSVSVPEDRYEACCAALAAHGEDALIYETNEAAEGTFDAAE